MRLCGLNYLNESIMSQDLTNHAEYATRIVGIQHDWQDGRAVADAADSDLLNIPKSPCLDISAASGSISVGKLAYGLRSDRSSGRATASTIINQIGDIFFGQSQTDLMTDVVVCMRIQQ